MTCCRNLCLFVTSLVAILLARRLQTYPQKTHTNLWLDEYQILEKHGYPYETHFITTKDGYILEVTRVLPPKIDKAFNESLPDDAKIDPKLMAKKFGEPVLLMHGFVSAARIWVAQYPEKATAFVLANHGYDVYLARARGTPGSRNHTTLDPDVDGEQFWNFSFHEIGLYDLPAIIDYIIDLTGFQAISYAGHSQGATSCFILTSIKPEYNAKIKILLSWGGAGGMSDIPSMGLRLLAYFERQVQAVCDFIGYYEFCKYVQSLSDLMVMADEQFNLKAVMSFGLNFYNVITTHHMDDIEYLPVIFNSYPVVSSLKQLTHFLQIISTKQFRMFNFHDKEKNLKVYGEEEPPLYNLSAITTRVVLYYTEFDEFTRGNDTKLMAQQMPNAITKDMNIEKFSHNDFIFASNLNQVLHKDMLWNFRNA